MFFSSVNFWSQGTPGGLLISSCQVPWPFYLSISALRGPLAVSWGLLAPAVGCCAFFLSVSFRPQGSPEGFLGAPGFQLKGIVCSFCLSISGLRGPLLHPTRCNGNDDSEGRTKTSSQQQHLEAEGNKHRPRARTMNRKFQDLCSPLQQRRRLRRRTEKDVQQHQGSGRTKGVSLASEAGVVELKLHPPPCSSCHDDDKRGTNR